MRKAVFYVDVTYDKVYPATKELESYKIPDYQRLSASIKDYRDYFYSYEEAERAIMESAPPKDWENIEWSIQKVWIDEN